MGRLTRLGFFDPDGFYFNPDGVDEFGGYYDEEGNYQEEYEGGDDDYLDPYGKHAGHHGDDDLEALQLVIEASQGPFVAALSNLPFYAREPDVEAELKAWHVLSSKVTFKYDKQNRLQQAYVHLPNKDAAKAILKLHHQQFLGRTLRINFPDLENGEEGFDDVPLLPPPSSATPAPAPAPAPPAQPAVEKEQARPPPPPAPRPSQDTKPVPPPPAEEQKKKVSKEPAAPKPVAQSSKKIGEMTPDELAKHMAQAGRAPVVATNVPATTGKPGVRKKGKK